jgi:hypothetical protein
MITKTLKISRDSQEKGGPRVLETQKGKMRTPFEQGAIPLPYICNNFLDRYYDIS